MQEFTSVVFPGAIEESQERPLATIMEEWIDKDFNLCLGPNTRIAPTVKEPSMKLVFRKITKADGSVSTEYLGYTTKEITYTNMADFSYKPPQESTHIVGPCISKYSVPSNYNFEPNPSMALLEEREAASRSSQEGTVASLKFRDEGPVPSKPTALAIELGMDEREQELTDKLRELFLQRPVWQRPSLEEALDLGTASDTARRIPIALRRVAYLFQDGPWRKCYVRYGYDPRTDPLARRLQVIDFRDPFLRGKSDSKTNSGPKDIHFRKAPTNRCQIYQLCEIEDAGIEALLNGPCRMMHADPRTGWLAEGELEAIRNQLKIRSESLRRL
jgi:hypothetical protein